MDRFWFLFCDVDAIRWGSSWKHYPRVIGSQLEFLQWQRCCGFNQRHSSEHRSSRTRYRSFQWFIYFARKMFSSKPWISPTMVSQALTVDAPGSMPSRKIQHWSNSTSGKSIVHFARLFRPSSTLFSHNRFNTEPATFIGRALARSESLQIVRVRVARIALFQSRNSCFSISSPEIHSNQRDATRSWSHSSRKMQYPINLHWLN